MMLWASKSLSRIEAGWRKPIRTSAANGSSAFPVTPVNHCADDLHAHEQGQRLSQQPSIEDSAKMEEQTALIASKRQDAELLRIKSDIATQRRDNSCLTAGPPGATSDRLMPTPLQYMG
jgi:hypothetical protein